MAIAIRLLEWSASGLSCVNGSCVVTIDITIGMTGGAATTIIAGRVEARTLCPITGDVNVEPIEAAMTAYVPAFREDARTNAVMAGQKARSTVLTGGHPTPTGF